MASGVELATAYVTLAVSTKGMGKDVSKEFAGVERDAGKAGKRIGGNLSSGIGGSLKMLGGIGAALGVADFLGDSIAEARESQKVGAITTQIIKSTGGAAKVTADHVGDLATAISNKTGVDDEQIQAGANMLLTFKNVKNEVGDGAKIFDRATAAAQDLSAAGFGDMAGQSKMLGKALNDPVKGISALSRSGVTFTEQQKKQIKTLVASGKTLEAQKIIMKEVESQVGGTAAASATAGEKLATTFGNFKESIGTALLPALDAVFTKASEFLSWLTTNMGPALAKVGEFFAPVVAAVKGFFTSLGGPDAKGAFSFAQGAFEAIAGFIRDEVMPRFLGIKDAVLGWINTVLPIAKAFVAGMLQRIQPLMPTIKEIFGTIGQIVTGAMDLIKAVIERVTAIIGWVWKNWGQTIMDTIAWVWTKVLAIVQPALETIRGIIKVFTSIFKGDWQAAWGAFKGIFSSAWRTVKAAVDLALGLLGKALGLAWAGIKTAAKLAWGGIVAAIKTVWGGLLSAIDGPVQRVLQFIQENLIDKINAVFAMLHIDLKINPIWTRSAPVGPKVPSDWGSRHKRGFADGGVLPGYTPGRDVHEFYSATGGNLSLSGGEPILRPEWGKVLGRGWVNRANAAARGGGVAGVRAFLGGGQSFANGGIFEAIGNVASTVGGFLTDPLGSLKKLIGSALGAVGSNPFAQMAAGLVGKGMNALIEKFKDLFSIGGAAPGGATGVVPGVKVLPGRRLDANTAARVAAAARSGVGFTVINGSWSNLAASMGTHAGAGAVDLWANDWNRGVSALRAQGMLAMFRNWAGNQHIHALNPNVSGLSSQALAQVRRARGSGGIFKDGGIVKPFVADSGVTLAPGINLLNNKLGKPEPLARTDQSGMSGQDWARIEQLLAAAVEAGAARGTAAGLGFQARELSMGGRR